MNRPSKKDIKASVDKLKEKSPGSGSSGGSGATKKTTPRKRKQGV